jgi:hypothetical protein
MDKKILSSVFAGVLSATIADVTMANTVSHDVVPNLPAMKVLTDNNTANTCASKCSSKDDSCCASCCACCSSSCCSTTACCSTGDDD